MSSKTFLLVALSLVALGAAIGLPLGFHPAATGEIDPGREAPADAVRAPRDRAVVYLSAAMAKIPGTPPTLADAVRFHGLEATTAPCAARATAGDLDLDEATVAKLVKQARRVGERVVLCLD